MQTENRYFPQSVPPPGATLAEKLDEMNMGPKEFAIKTGKPEKTISEVLSGSSRITAEMGVLFQRVTGIPAHFWANAQAQYDEYLERRKMESQKTEAKAWLKSFPLKALQSLGWIEKKNNWSEDLEVLLSFFGVGSIKAWHKYYFEAQLKVEFRISLTHSKAPEAISAWLRKGELQAREIVTVKYEEQKFRNALSKLKPIVAEAPKDFFISLQNICLAAGVKVVYTPSLPSAPISGSTRWLNDNPLIQLTGRYKTYDSFWFTFFHEAGHIILHGKKDIFLENVDYDGASTQKEQEANSFAEKLLLSKEEEDCILNLNSYDPANIISLAKKFETHTSIIVGRLRNKNLISYAQLVNLCPKIELELHNKLETQ